MATRAAKPGAKKSARPRRSAAVSRDTRVASGGIEQSVKKLEKAIDEIQTSLRKVERQIEADARARIRDLRRDARTQLAVLKAKQREAARILENASVAAEGSWQEVKQSATTVVSDARRIAAASVERLRKVLTR